jgi:hypothetical protein
LGIDGCSFVCSKAAAGMSCWLAAVQLQQSCVPTAQVQISTGVLWQHCHTPVAFVMDTFRVYGTLSDACSLYVLICCFPNNQVTKVLVPCWSEGTAGDAGVPTYDSFSPDETNPEIRAHAANTRHKP